MDFGTVSLDTAEGGILAHSLRSNGFVLKKGTLLTSEHIVKLTASGIETICIARLSVDDIEEDKAALSLAMAAQGANLTCDKPFTGRCNLRAASSGVLRVAAQAVNAANAVDEALTLATPPDYARLNEGQLAATAKVIPYAARNSSVERVTDLLDNALTLHPFQPMTTALITTQADGQKDSIITKGAEAVSTRLASLGSPRPDSVTVPHSERAIVDALQNVPPADLVLILGGSATSDRRDVAPAAVSAAGGTIERFGMPVDPGNLLVLGQFRGKPLVVLPGCARSLALNGADWVLERIAARLPVNATDIAAMGVGGLLKEIPTRPQPRER